MLFALAETDRRDGAIEPICLHGRPLALSCQTGVIRGPSFAGWRQREDPLEMHVSPEGQVYLFD